MTDIDLSPLDRELKKGGLEERGSIMGARIEKRGEHA